MAFDGFILGNRLVVLHPIEKGRFEFIEGRPSQRESKPLNTWNNSAWARAPRELKSASIEQIHVRESAFNEVRALIEQAREQGNYIIFLFEEFKRTVFINHTEITKRDIEKIFQCKVSIRKRKNRELLIFYPEPT